MAVRTIQSTDPDLLTALGGVTTDGDSVYVDRYGVNYTGADLSGSSRDLALLELTKGYNGSIAAGAGGAQLKCVCNQAGAGIFRNRSNSQRIELISTSSAGVIANVENDPESGGVLDVNTAAVENARAISGTMNVQSGCDLEQAYCYGNAVLNLRYATYILDYVYARGGKSVIERDFVAMDVEAKSEAIINDVRVTPATGIYLKGGIVRARRMGTCALLSGGSGLVDFLDLELPVIISARACEPGVTLLFSRRSYGLVTFTSVAGDTGGGPLIVIKE